MIQRMKSIGAGTFLGLWLAVGFPLDAAGQPAPPSGTGTAAASKGDAKNTGTEKEAGEEGKPPPATLDLSNPRAAMQTFLVAIQDADGDRPDRIDDAVRCMDLSGLEGDGEAVQERARSLARRLHMVIVGHGVKLEDIPDKPEDSEFKFLAAEPVERGGEAVEVRLRADAATGEWRFTPETLSALPALEASVEKKKHESPPKPAVNDEVPVVRRTPRATMGTFLDAMSSDPPDITAAIMCLDPTGQDAETWAVKGKELATKLKNVMDKTRVVVLADIPEATDDGRYVWYTGQTGNITIGQIVEQPSGFPENWSFAPKKGEWRFTPQTLKTIDTLYEGLEREAIVSELRDVGVEEQLTFSLRLERQMPPWLREEYLGLAGWQWVAVLGLLPAGWLIRLVVAWIATLLLGLWLRRKKVDLDRAQRRRAMRAIGTVAAVLSWYLAIQYLDLPDKWLAVLFRGTKFALALTAAWASYRQVDVLGGYITSNKDIRLTEIDEVLIPLLSRVLRIVVGVVVVLFVLQWAGYAPTSVLGALGIGGVALAFASQETLGNFFGSITVLLDRPFGLGDWIVIGDIEGTVERVGFRSTRVRTFYNSVVTIPNSRMVNTNVDNYGARRYRRIRVMLSVTYDTPPEKLDAFCEGIRELIRLHPYTRKDYYHVYFNQFAASSLDILLYTFLEAPDWGTELRERHRLFADIIRLAKRLGVEFAFPTQTVWLERSAGGKVGDTGLRVADDPEATGFEEAARLFRETRGDGSAGCDPVVIQTVPRSKTGQTSDGGGG